jgi:hypothetical protein
LHTSNPCRLLIYLNNTLNCFYIYHGYLEERLHAHYAVDFHFGLPSVVGQQEAGVDLIIFGRYGFYRDETSLLSVDMVATGNAFDATIDGGLTLPGESGFISENDFISQDILKQQL